MQRIRIPQAYVDRVTARAGRAHTVDALNGPRTALVVVDMQDYFMGEGQPAECPQAREIVPTINRLARATREAGGLVVWIQTQSGQESLNSWSVYYERTTPSKAEARVVGMSPGGSGFELWHELDVLDGDEVVIKTRFSAFIQGSSRLEEMLRTRDIDTVMVSGVATSTCCESTARDGMMLNFRTLMISDACADGDPYLHEASLTKFYVSFGDVRSSDEAIDLLLRRATAPPA